MFKSHRLDSERPKRSQQKSVRLFLEELEGRCLLSHQITPIGGITTAPDGHIWFLEQDRLGRIDPSTGVIQEFAIGTPMGNSTGFTPVSSPIVAAPDGTLWFFSNNQATRFDPATYALARYSVPETLMQASLAVGADGDVWVGEYQRENWDLVRIHPSTGGIQEYAMGEYHLLLTNIAIAGDGRVWATGGVGVAGAWFSSVDVLNPLTGTVQVIPIGTWLDTIFTGKDGSVFFMTGADEQVSSTAGYQILSRAAIDRIFNQKYGQQHAGMDVLCGPYHQDKNGNIWIKMSYPAANEGISKFNPATGEIAFFTEPNWPWVWDTTEDANGRIWFTDASPAVRRLDPATGLFETFDQGTEAPAPSANAPPAAGTTVNATAGIDFVTAVATFTPQTPVPSIGAAYQATVDWGDGTTSSVVLTVMQNASYDVTAGHIYQTAGTYSIKVTIGTYDPANPLGDNPITVFSTANVDPFNIVM
jgi:streptogramin lyase